MIYPKILIIGQSFNKKSGGGVTMSNLFKGWPKDKLAVASNTNLYNDLDSSICNTYYQLGYNNKLHPFPLNIILPQIKCGLLTVTENNNNRTDKPVKTGKYRLIYKLINALLHFSGLYNIFYQLKITREFKAWIKEYNPDVIYTQLASLELIRFINDLHIETGKPVAIHMMDDWPLTINKPGLFYYYWQKIIDKEFRQLLDKSAILMSICDAMTEEYALRYGKNFIPFHNPIDIDYWKPTKSKIYNTESTFTILYAGRIGFGIETSLQEIANAVNEIAKTNKNIVFEIQTGDDQALKELITTNDFVKGMSQIPYSELPQKFSSVDLLLLPQDFDDKSIQFLKYSFPTKVSEYMISGTPILVYGDVRTGLTKYAIKDNWCYVVTENDTQALIKAITELYHNPGLREKLAKTAQAIAIEKEDASKVRNDFRMSFILN